MLTYFASLFNNSNTVIDNYPENKHYSVLLWNNLCCVNHYLNKDFKVTVPNYVITWLLIDFSSFIEYWFLMMLWRCFCWCLYCALSTDKRLSLIFALQNRGSLPLPQLQQNCSQQICYGSSPSDISPLDVPLPSLVSQASKTPPALVPLTATTPALVPPALASKPSKIQFKIICIVLFTIQSSQSNFTGN